MISDYPCPLCKSRNWEPVQEYTCKAGDPPLNSIIKNERLINLFHYFGRFARSFIFASPKPKTMRAKLLNSYEKLRRDVLFNVWFPRREEISITSHYCLDCGFMAYSPRPDETDISSKYRFLGEKSRPEEIDEYNAYLENDPYSIRTRQQIYELVEGASNKEKISILDCGGASGWYLVPFAENGCACDLVDYETGQIEGIRKVGDDISELKEKEVYDAVICRAVLEHLADPLAVVKMFRALLKAQGVVYAMVPCEIYAGIDRIGYDAATHINFFTPGSFETLFRLADFEIISSGSDEIENIWILARKKAGEGTRISDFRVDIEKYLYPERWETVRKLFSRFMP